MEISLHSASWSYEACCSYLCLKALNQDGHQQVEEDIVSKGHEGHEVKSGKWWSGCHAIVQNNVPVLLRQNLRDLHRWTHIEAINSNHEDHLNNLFIVYRYIYKTVQFANRLLQIGALSNMYK